MTLQAATTSTGATVSNPEAVRELCESYCFGTLNWEVTEDGELTTWGFDDFELCEARENGLPDYEGGIVTHEFLRELANHLEAGKEIDIQTAGFTEVQGESPAVNGGDKSDTFMPLAPIGWHIGVPPPGHTSFAGTDASRPRPTG